MAYISGTPNSEILVGTPDNDYIYGGNGNDLVFGGDGNDTINGWSGNDTFSGGNGSNSFVYYNNFNSTSGVDVITDFKQFNTDPNADDLGERDLIAIYQYSFGLSSDFGIGFSDPSEFEVVASDADTPFSNALITFSRSTGNLFYNQNRAVEGFGSGGQFVTLPGVTDLTPDSFQIIPNGGENLSGYEYRMTYL